MDKAMHVIPCAKGYAVRRSGSARASVIVASKAEAISYARARCAAVYLHRRDGQVERKWRT
jgi:hypothetical protein